MQNYAIQVEHTWLEFKKTDIELLLHFQCIAFQFISFILIHFQCITLQHSIFINHPNWYAWGYWGNELRNSHRNKTSLKPTLLWPLARWATVQRYEKKTIYASTGPGIVDACLTDRPRSWNFSTHHRQLSAAFPTYISRVSIARRTRRISKST